MRSIRSGTASAVVASLLALVLMAMFVIGAVELAGAQSSQRSEIKTEVNDRVVLTASLINSLFQTAGQNGPTYGAKYGTTVPVADLDAAVATGNSVYAVVTDAAGHVLGASRSFGHGTLPFSPSVLSQIAAGDKPYYVGDITTFKGRPVIGVVVPFAAPGGTRLYVSAIAMSGVSFLHADLAAVPGVAGQSNYILDDHNVVVASSDPKLVAGSPAPSGVSPGRPSAYETSVPLRNTSWRVLLVAPRAALFASVDGAHEIVPWIIFGALVLVAAIAMILGLQALRRATEVRTVNARLAEVNEELRQANTSLERRAAELARSNEELDSFASIASHDLQEPLRKVRTFNTQLTVLEAANLSDKGRDYLARSNAAAERMQQLIEDLLKFSRVSTQGRPFEPVDLAEVVSRVVGDLEGLIDAAGAVVETGPLPVIDADPLQMQQLLQNLISNGIKFHRHDVQPKVRVTGRIEGDGLKLEVADNGIGFEPRYAERIFRIFERLNGRTAYPGTGIGLALCRKIADRHGGSIEAIGLPERGASFIVTLPLHQAAGSSGFGAHRAASEDAGDALPEGSPARVETVDA